jgi:regulator of replication initiation timing
LSTARKSFGITKQHGEHLHDVIAWLSVQEGTTPLEIGVLEEITERVEHRALDGARLRVRLKNRGNPRRAMDGPQPERGVWHRWSDEDRDRLARLFREGKHVDVIADEMGKSQGAIEDQIARLGLWHSRPKPLPRTIHYNSNGALTRAKEAYAARKRREMGATR